MQPLISHLNLFGLPLLILGCSSTMSHALVDSRTGFGHVVGVQGSAFPYDDTHYPGGDSHDPNVVEVNGTYVMVATSGHELAPVCISDDMVHWKPMGPIMEEQPRWLVEAVPQHRSVWAPAPFVMGKVCRVYYCASQRFGSNTSFIGYAENANFNPKTPCEGWVDKGMIIASHAGVDDFNAIDPDVVAGPDGRQWMAFGSYWSGVYLLELNPVTGGTLESAHPIRVAANPAERNNPLEAPLLRFHDGYYYLYVTYGLAAQGVRSTYRMMVGRSKEPEGPYVGFDGRPMLEGGHTVILKASPPMFGPGGGNLFQDDKGDWWFAYHYYDGTRHWVGDMWGAPTMQIRRVVWGPDGWPLPGMPAGIELTGARRTTLAGTWVYQADFGTVVSLSLDSKGGAKLPYADGKWILNGDILTLEWPTGEGLGEHYQDVTLTLDRTHQFFVGRDPRGAVVRGIRQDAKVHSQL